MPRGSLPAGVYWRRRVFVLGTVAAVIFMLVTFVRGLGDDVAPPARATQASAETEPSATPTSTTPANTVEQGKQNANGKNRKNRQNKKNRKNQPNDGTATTPQEQTPQPPVTVLPEPTGACEDADVQISPFVLGAVAGRRVTFTLQLRTTESVACRWRFSVRSVALKITHNGEDVWTSWRCRRQMPDVAVVVRRDSTATVDFHWRARTSTSGCGRTAPWAAPGTYQIRASTFGGVPSDEVEFTLARP